MTAFMAACEDGMSAVSCIERSLNDANMWSTLTCQSAITYATFIDEQAYGPHPTDALLCGTISYFLSRYEPSPCRMVLPEPIWFPRRMENFSTSDMSERERPLLSMLMDHRQDG